MLGIVMLSVIMLNVTYKPFMLSVVMLSVVMLSVVAPISPSHLEHSIHLNQLLYLTMLRIKIKLLI